MTVIVDEHDIATTFYHAVNPTGSPTDDILKAIASWKRAESGHTIQRNNPWNLTFVANMPGFKAMDGGFAEFIDLEHGIIASEYFLTFPFNDGDWRGYGPIIAAIKANDAPRFMQVVAQSAWDAGKYGTTTGGPNNIVKVFDSFGSFLMDTVNPGPAGTLTSNNPTYNPPKGVTLVTTGNTAIDVQVAAIDKNLSDYITNKLNAGITDPAQYASYFDEIRNSVNVLAGLADNSSSGITPTPTPTPVPSTEPTAVSGPVLPPAPPARKPATVEAIGDASWQAELAAGNTPGHGMTTTNPYQGVASSEGYSGVMSSTGPKGLTYLAYRDGVILGETTPNDSTFDAVAWGSSLGINAWVEFNTVNG